MGGRDGQLSQILDHESLHHTTVPVQGINTQYQFTVLVHSTSALYIHVSMLSKVRCSISVYHGAIIHRQKISTKEEREREGRGGGREKRREGKGRGEGEGEGREKEGRKGKRRGGRGEGKEGEGEEREKEGRKGKKRERGEG